MSDSEFDLSNNKDNIINWCKVCQIEAVYNKEEWLWYCPKCKAWTIYN